MFCLAHFKKSTLHKHICVSFFAMISIECNFSMGINVSRWLSYYPTCVFGVEHIQSLYFFIFNSLISPSIDIFGSIYTYNSFNSLISSFQFPLNSFQVVIIKTQLKKEKC